MLPQPLQNVGVAASKTKIFKEFLKCLHKDFDILSPTLNKHGSLSDCIKDANLCSHK